MDFANQEHLLGNFIPFSLEIGYGFFEKSYAACIEKNMLCMFLPISIYF